MTTNNEVSWGRRAAIGTAATFLGLASARRAGAQTVKAEAGWARAPAVPGGAVALYFTLRGGAAPDQLVGVEPSAGGMAMLHESATANGVATMRMLEAIDIPAGGVVVLRPGGLHVMLEGLAQPPRDGQTLTVVLRFARASPLALTAVVRAPGAAAP